MQGQRLHLSIYHPDWLAKSTSCFPPPSLSPIPLPLCQSLILRTPILFQPPLPRTRPHPSIRPSIFCPRPSISHSLPSVPCLIPPSPSLFCMSFCFLPPAPASPPRSRCLRVRTQLKCPEGASFKHRNQKHMAHFQLPRSITAIYPEIAAKFPKVSSRFTTDCNVCLSHFLNQASFLCCLSPLPLTLHQIFQRLSSGF